MLIDLAFHFIEFCDKVDEILRVIYYEIFNLIINRYEFNLCIILLN